MCPGGWIVPAATEPDGVVRQRHEPVAPRLAVRELGLVVTVEPRRLAVRAARGPARRHRAAARASSKRRSRAGGGRFVRPAQRLADFLAGRASCTRRPRRATGPGSRAADLRTCCPPFVAEALRAGAARHRRRRCPASCPPRRVLVGGRDAHQRARSACCATRRRWSRPSLAGLYPCGEGAGYAGGIVSAALDGARVADAHPRHGVTGRRPERVRAPISREHLTQPGPLLVADDFEADAGGVAVGLRSAAPTPRVPSPTAAACRPRRRRAPGTGRWSPLRLRPAADRQFRPAPPSERSRVVAVNTVRAVRTSADMRRSCRWCCRRGAGTVGVRGIESSKRRDRPDPRSARLLFVRTKLPGASVPSRKPTNMSR